MLVKPTAALGRWACRAVGLRTVTRVDAVYHGSASVLAWQDVRPEQIQRLRQNHIDFGSLALPADERELIPTVIDLAPFRIPFRFG